MSELRIGPASAELRASLRPIEWMVLEELALAAGADETGVLVAPTSVRAVAERLGLTAGAVARALASLRAVGLVSHLRHCGPSGRFGPSSYVLNSIPGLDVVDPGPAPCEDPSCLAAPCVEAAHMGTPSMENQPGDTGGVAGRRVRRGSPPAVAAAPMMVSGPGLDQERPPRNNKGRCDQGKPPRHDVGLQLELLAAPPSGSATKRAPEHGR